MKKSGVKVIAFRDLDNPHSYRPPIDFVKEHFNNTQMPTP